MQATQSVLKALPRGGRTALGRPSGDLEGREVPPLAYPDPKAVQPLAGRVAAGLAVGLADPSLATATFVGKDSVEASMGVRARREAEERLDPVEQPGLPLGSQERAQQLAAGVRIVTQPPEELVPGLELPVRPRAPTGREEPRGNVPVPGAADETREPSDPLAGLADDLRLVRRHQMTPDRKATRQTPELSVDPVNLLGR